MAHPPTNAELLHELYEKRDPRIGLLYKYRSCSPHNLDILSRNGIWLSRHEHLNDPFDCLIRLPVHCSAEDLSGLAKLLRGAPPYTLEIENGEDAMQYIAAAKELKPLDCIGLLAGQLHRHELLEHIKVVRSDDTEWLVTLVELSADLHRTMLADTGLSRSRKPQITPSCGLTTPQVIRGTASATPARSASTALATSTK